MFNSELEEKKVMLGSEAFQDVLNSNLQDEIDGEVEELRTLLKGQAKRCEEQIHGRGKGLAKTRRGSVGR